MWDEYCLLSRSVVCWLPSSLVDSACTTWRDALGGLAAVYQLVHELSWTCDCREAPALVRPTLDACVPSVPWEQYRPLKSACVLLPISWEAAFATSCLRRVHPLGVMRRFYSQSALPRG